MQKKNEAVNNDIKSKTAKSPCNIGKPQASGKEFIPVKLAASGNPKVKK